MSRGLRDSFLRYCHGEWIDCDGDPVEIELVVHAHWVDRYGGRYANPLYECSACLGKAYYEIKVDMLGHEHIAQMLSNYCPHCGAHMDEQLELRTCYCPICDKHFEIRSNDSGGSCPDCGHHVVLHKVEVADA